MKAEERRVLQRVLRAWETMLETLNRMGPESDRREDIDGYGQVKDYVLDRIDDCAERLTKAAQEHAERRGRKPALLRPTGNGLHGGDNRLDNAARSGVDNG